MIGCISCGRGLPEECENNCEEEREKALQALAIEEEEKKTPYYKSDDKVTDVLSTGRKRAAKLYGHLIDGEYPCEWRLKKNVGGGIPISGCINGFAQDIHHGPDKNTLNNERHNIHLICKTCHKRWHITNDPVYDRDKYINTKHEPLDATREELYAYNLVWLRTPKAHFKVDEDRD